MKILLVDDDRELCQLLKEYMTAHGCQVDMVHDGPSALAVENIDAQYDILTLDIMMPGMSGLEVLPALRARSSIPVIMVTGRGDEVDRIVGLEMGADDYIPKPCNPRELLARINAVLRRYRKSMNEASSDTLLKINLQGLQLDSSTREVHLNDQEIHLTGAEFDALKQLIMSRGTVVSKAELTESVLHRKLTQYDRSIDVHVSRVRQKLKAITPNTEWIKTVRGSGYIFTITQ